MKEINTNKALEQIMKMVNKVDDDPACLKLFLQVIYGELVLNKGQRLQLGINENQVDVYTSSDDHSDDLECICVSCFKRSEEINNLMFRVLTVLKLNGVKVGHGMALVMHCCLEIMKRNGKSSLKFRMPYYAVVIEIKKPQLELNR